MIEFFHRQIEYLLKYSKIVFKMVLWKKESANDDACHVDLLSSKRINVLEFEIYKSSFGIIQKNEMVSTERRKQGNELFKAKNWTEAIEQYNQSIRFAYNGSENLGLAYANRSACFLHLKMYEKCLADIELARKANYPQKLMQKLDEREAECSKKMKESTKENEKVTPELSFASNTKFPALANILEVRSNNEFGKHIVTKRDIDVGKIVMLEDAFVFGVDLRLVTVCKTCAKHTTNFIPCPNCADVMFCNQKCMDSNNIHGMVCGALYNRWPRYMLIVESILIAVFAFSNAESLARFVDSALSTRDFDSPECESSSQAKYRSFLKLFAVPKDVEAVEQQIYDAYKLLLEIPLIAKFFYSKQEKRFLMHLIWQHLRISRTNSFGTRRSDAEYLTTVGNVSSLFNHSCALNLCLLTYGNKMIAYVLRPVKKGEQLFISYYNQNANVPSAQKALEFQCKCSKCVPCWKQEDRIRIQSDINYLFFMHVEDSDFKDCKKRSVLKVKFQKFFTKFGRLPWSPEFIAMEIGFAQCCSEELAAWDY